MKKTLTSILCLLASAVCSPVFAQGTAFTYQGRLNAAGSPANGAYDFRFRLASDEFGNNFVGGPVLSNALPVNGGLFVVTLNFGAGIFTGSNYWLQVDVKTNGAGNYTTLIPLQALTPAPYAIFAGTASNLSSPLSSGQLVGTYSGAVTFNNPSNNFTGNGGGLTNVNATTLGGLGANQFWKTGGNSNTVPGANFVGTADNQPLHLAANGTRALRIEPNTNGAPNMIGGAPVNYVEPGVVGATIAGGGAVSGIFFLGTGSNRVSAIFGTIGGGRMNTVAADHGFIGGGISNTVYAFAYDAVIGGGVGNAAHTNAFEAVIGGGLNNTIQRDVSYAVIAGGVGNTIQTNVSSATISGGQNNTLGGFDNYGTISGGSLNSVGINSSSATISGGFANVIGANTLDATVGGGSFNVLGTNCYGGTIGGGGNNTVSTNSMWATIAGGYRNFVQTNSSFATIGGGLSNLVLGTFATVPGGFSNAASGAYAFAAGRQARSLHSGSFVWADSQNAPFSSTTSNQFNVRANGGARFITGGFGITVDGSSVALRAGGNFFTGSQIIVGPDGGQLILQNLTDAQSWSIYDENFGGSGALIFAPNTGVGAYISRVDGSYHMNSDARLKRDITPLTGTLDRLLRLRPVSYHYRSAIEGTPMTLGLIAQEVQPLFPEVVGERGGMLSLAYSELVPVTIRAVQELNGKLEVGNQKAEDRIRKLEAENTELKQELGELKKIVSSLVPR